MRASVFTDRALTRHAGRFVWLSIDSENESNASFGAAYAWEALPTFQVIDPRNGRVVYRWLGAVDVRQLEQRFAEAERAMAAASGTDADAAYTRAVRLDAEGKRDEAIRAFEEALGAADDDWPPRGRAAESLVFALSQADAVEPCARRAAELVPTLPRTVSRANVAATGLGCALGADPSAAWRAASIAGLEASVREALGFDGLLSDDRAGLLAALLDVREALNDDAGIQVAARALLDFLEADAKRAPTAEARAALDGFRVSAALAAKDPGRVLAPLEASERELPHDYNPPARLSIVLRELGRFDEALAASDRALAKAYGPRKLALYDARATLLERKGDRAGARAALEAGLAFGRTIPEAQRPKGTLARIERRLVSMAP